MCGLDKSLLLSVLNSDDEVTNLFYYAVNLPANHPVTVKSRTLFLSWMRQQVALQGQNIFSKLKLQDSALTDHKFCCLQLALSSDTSFVLFTMHPPHSQDYNNLPLDWKFKVGQYRLQQDEDGDIDKVVHVRTGIESELPMVFSAEDLAAYTMENNHSQQEAIPE